MRWTLVTTIAMTTAATLVVSLNRAQGALGDEVSEPAHHTAPIDGKSKVLTENDNYKIIETQGQHYTVREYVASGKVFAVAWSGRTQPDLQNILGTSFEEFSAAQKAKSGPRITGRQAYNSITSGDLVVERFGRVGALGGKAYLKSKMPAGMSADAIK